MFIGDMKNSVLNHMMKQKNIWGMNLKYYSEKGWNSAVNFVCLASLCSVT